MRKKFAMRKRRELLRRGAEITREEFLYEPGWRRKDCGYVVDFVYQNHRVLASGNDMLDAFSGALEVIDDIVNLLSEQEDDHPGVYCIVTIPKKGKLHEELSEF